MTDNSGICTPRMYTCTNHGILMTIPLQYFLHKYITYVTGFGKMYIAHMYIYDISHSKIQKFWNNVYKYCRDDRGMV